MNVYKKTATIAALMLAAITMTGCDVNPLNWVAKAKHKVETTVSADATPEEKTEFLAGIPKPIMPVAPACSNDPALILCKTYPSVDALLADPNVKKFGFSITVNGVEVHKGQQPDIKYRQLKDGSVTRG